MDFGQNIAGYISFTIHAHQGQKIFLRFGEMFDENGEFTQKNIQCRNKRAQLLLLVNKLNIYVKREKTNIKPHFLFSVFSMF